MELRRTTKTTLQLTALIMAHGTVGGLSAQTEPSPAEPIRLPEVIVSGEAEADAAIHPPFLPPVQGPQINAGKKSVVMDLDALPDIANNNYRQALNRTPSLLISEETSPLVSIGYRGLNPHRAQFTQVLKDGIPIHADQFGYPEAYYTPPLDTVDRLEFVHGGAALMYGPQPGGALNYVTHRPRLDREFSARTKHIFGSDGLYSTFTSFDGTVDRVGYYAFFNHRQWDGFRDANHDFDLFAGSVKLVLDATSDSRWVFNYDGYAEEHGEPGGLTFATGPNTVNYDADRNATTRFFDRFKLDRHFGSLAWERDFSESTALTVTGWGGYYSRYSHRQRSGGDGAVNTSTFGVIPNGANAMSNTIELQEFYTKGLEARLRHDWVLGGNIHTLAGGVQLYHTDSPRRDERGAAPDATSGQLRGESEREVFYAPLFLENRFVFGNLSLTPGVRLENYWQSVEEKVNVERTAAGIPLADESEHNFVPLFGLGVEYAVLPEVIAYGNVSQSYRPKIFTEAVPSAPGTLINSDLEESNIVQYEVGFRGQPRPYLYWDTSLFWMDFDDQIGMIGNSLQNVGRAVHRGWEAAGELELLGWTDALTGSAGRERQHAFSLYGNVMLLDAEFVSGPADGNTPQYAPDHILRTGAIYRWNNRLKVAFLGTRVDDHFANDNNTDQFKIPAYMVWDLTAEVKLYKDHLSILAGINNLFDEDYYARIRSDGIDPAYGRNFYAGLSLAY